jgi:hypothetical protein
MPDRVGHDNLRQLVFDIVPKVGGETVLVFVPKKQKKSNSQPLTRKIFFDTNTKTVSPPNFWDDIKN